MHVHDFLAFIIPYVAGTVELIGLAIITIGVVFAIYYLLKNHFDFNCREVKISLAQSLVIALEFKLAAEILYSVTINTTEELIKLASIVLLRAFITYQLHWEIKSSETHEDQFVYADKPPKKSAKSEE